MIYLEPRGVARAAGRRACLWPRRRSSERFHYRRPGLWLLAVQVFRSPSAAELPVWPELAGCHSWVELPVALPTDDLTSVLEPDALARRLTALRAGFDSAGETSATGRSHRTSRLSAIGDTAAIPRRCGIGGRHGGHCRAIRRRRRNGRAADFDLSAGSISVDVAHSGSAGAARRAGVGVCGPSTAWYARPLRLFAGRPDRGAIWSNWLGRPISPRRKPPMGNSRPSLAAFDAALDAWQRSG